MYGEGEQLTKEVEEAGAVQSKGQLEQGFRWSSIQMNRLLSGAEGAEGGQIWDYLLHCTVLFTAQCVSCNRLKLAR